MKLISFGLLFLMMSTSHAMDLNLEGGLVQANNNEGSSFSGEVVSKLNSDLTASLFYNQISRIFNGNTKLKDDQFGANLAYTFSPRFYLEGRFTYSSDSVFFPENSMSITPHYIWGGFDLWLGFTNSKYPSGSIQMFKAGLLKELEGDLILGGQVFSANSTPSANSAHVFAAKTFPNWKTRLDLAGGKTIEDDNLVGSFKSATLTTLYRFPNFRVGPKVSLYDGSLREEQIYLLHLEVTL